MIYVHGELKRRDSFIKKDFFYLKEYFQLYKRITNGKNMKIKKYISNLDEIVQHYENIVDKYFEESHKQILSELIRIQNTENYFFEKEINFKDNNYYWLYFDVAKLNEITKQKKLAIHKVKLSDINYDSDGLMEVNVKKAGENSLPVIIGKFEHVRLMTVLDGNHRVTFKERNNEKYIDAYILNHEELSQCFISDFFKAIFYIHRNLYYMILYMTGNISKFKMSKEIIPLINQEKLSFMDYLSKSIRRY